MKKQSKVLRVHWVRDAEIGKKIKEIRMGIKANKALGAKTLKENRERNQQHKEDSKEELKIIRDIKRTVSKLETKLRNLKAKLSSS